MLQQNTTKRIGYWFLLLHQKFEEDTAAALREENLTRRQWQVLHAVAIGVDSVVGVDKAFAPFLVVDRVPTLRPVVEQLAARGWFTVEQDGRVRLTASGDAAHARANDLVEAHAGKSLRGISEQEFATANAVLSKIAGNLSVD